MKKTIYLFASGLIAIMAGIPSSAQEVGAAIPGEYIVQLKPGAAAGAVAARHAAKPTKIFTKAVNGFSGPLGAGQVRNLTADPAVLAVVPDRVVSAYAKPSGGGTVTTPPPPQEVPAGVIRIGAAPANGLAQTGAGIGVAIVDTGLDFAQADLNISSLSFSAYGGSAQDQNGHGTHVGGTVAALNNAINVVGVAPEATLYAVRVLDRRGSGTDSTIIAGFDWIAANATANPAAPIRVANVSLGRPGSADDNPVLHAAVQSVVAAGVTVVVAAGNDCDLEVWQQVPACYSEVISVASTTARNGSNPYISIIDWDPVADTASYFTTDGATITISAPGEEAENVVRTRGGYAVQSIGILSTKLGGGTTRMSGTSMAAPHVAGVAALLAQQDSTITPAGIKARIIASADNTFAPYANKVQCYDADGVLEGILHAGKALTPPAPTEPTSP